MIIFDMRLKFFFIFIILFLSSCENFKRFGQEKYTCAQNKLSIYQIDIIKTNSVEKAYMITDQGEVSLQVNISNKDKILLTNGNLSININKQMNEVSVSDENKIHFLKCKNETFNM